MSLGLQTRTEARQHHLACRRALDARKNLDQRRLPSAVGTQQAKHTPGVQAQVDAPQSPYVAKSFRELPHLDRRGHQDSSFLLTLSPRLLSARNVAASSSEKPRAAMSLRYRHAAVVASRLATCVIMSLRSVTKVPSPRRMTTSPRCSNPW